MCSNWRGMMQHKYFSTVTVVVAAIIQVPHRAYIRNSHNYSPAARHEKKVNYTEHEASISFVFSSSSFLLSLLAMVRNFRQNYYCHFCFVFREHNKFEKED